VNAFQSQVIAALAAQGSGSVWSVWSPKLAVATAVRQILIGSQCDTQRGRNANRAEGYTGFAVAGIAVAPDDPNLETIDTSMIDLAKMIHNRAGEEPPDVPEVEKPLPVEIIEP
jgi:hypothetical protein